MHVAEVRKTSQALIVELRECRHEAVAFSRRQGVGILSDPHHHRERTNQRGSQACFDLHVAVAAAGAPEPAGGEKWHRYPIDRDRECQIGGERSGRATAKPDLTTAGR